MYGVALQTAKPDDSVGAARAAAQFHAALEDDSTFGPAYAALSATLPPRMRWRPTCSAVFRTVTKPRSSRGRSSRLAIRPFS
jgi:hypothetical protein